MKAVGDGNTRTPMRTAFEEAKVERSAGRKPADGSRSLLHRVRRKLKGRAGCIHHKKMAYVTRPPTLLNGRLVS